MAGFTITIAGDSALNLEFAHAISAETSAKIRMAADNLTADPIRGITELVPTFCSLMVYYNPLVITFDELSTKLRSKLRDVGEADLSIRKIVPIPVCYGGEFGPDLANVAQLAGLSEDEVIAIHTERDSSTCWASFPASPTWAASTSACTRRAWPCRARASSRAASG